MKTFSIVMLAASILLMCVACQKSYPAHNADGGADSDSDGDTDTDTDTWPAGDCPEGWTCFADVTCDNDEDGQLDVGWAWLGESGGLPGALRSESEFTVEGDGVVLDEVTGLRWQRCSVGQGGDDCSTGFAATYMFSELTGLCEATYGADWRVPRADELATLVDHGESWLVDGTPVVEATTFPGTAAAEYWTSTQFLILDGEDADHPYRSIVDFQNGRVTASEESPGSKIVRCILDGADGEIGPRFGVDPVTDDEAQDLRTGLIWRRCAEGQEWSGTTCTGAPDNLSVEDADAICTGGWRLPDIREAFSIANHCFRKPALDPEVFPGAPEGIEDAANYWSSTIGVHLVDEIRWVVSLRSGGTSNFDIATSDDCFVRCVRDP